MDEKDYLPRTLPFGRLDTGIPISSTLAALLVGMGDGLQTGYRVIDERFNPDRYKDNDSILSQLMNNKHVGTQARIGYGIGLLADPGNVMLSPLIKGAKK